MQSKLFSTNITLRCAGQLIDLSTPRVMGILNVTPDSFFDGGFYSTEKDILSQTERMLTDGATFIDVGGYSTRPGAEDISLQEELDRVRKAIRLIVKEFPHAIVSIDTFRAEVAGVAVGEGACMINDISGGRLDPEMFATVASLQVPYILMHSRGTPQTMKELASYENLSKEMIDYFHSKIAMLQELKIKDILIDPGFGFAKNSEQNFELLHYLDHFKILGKPLLVGASRKSMIWKTLDTNPEDALNGTSVLNTIALLKGASILRVHDVKEAMEVIKLVGKVHRQPD